MLCDSLDMAIRVIEIDDHYIVDYAFGCERTKEIIESGQIITPPRKNNALGAITLRRNAIKVSSMDELDEMVWKIWESKRFSNPHYKNTREPPPTCIAFSSFASISELFTRCITRNLKERTFAGPNPIADFSTLQKLTGKENKSKKYIRIDNYLKIFWKFKGTLKSIHPALSDVEPKTYFAFDMEAWGFFHFERPFSIGAGLFQGKRLLEKKRFSCHPDLALTDKVTDRQRNWVKKNVLKHHPDIASHRNHEKMIEGFKRYFDECRRTHPQMQILVDRGFPLEVNFCQMVGIHEPIIDVRALVQTLKVHPEIVRDEKEYPIHDPLADALWAYYEYRDVMRQLSKK